MFCSEKLNFATKIITPTSQNICIEWAIDETLGRRMFVDKVTLNVNAGNGGDGYVGFRHEKFIERGGPDGGDGGKGGDVVVVASYNQNTLASYRYKKQLVAVSGDAGSKRKRHGKNGEDLELVVPVGTVVSNLDGDTIADFTEDGQKVIIAKGGRGGYGNAHFTSSVRQAPRVAEKGEPGEELGVCFELKMIADVGLVGLPNAGKSTLLACISNARPEIANYPFTTLRPNLGVVDIGDNESLLFADIPGLIEGASQGKGLGDEFLRHIERTKVLIHLVDIYQDDIGLAYKTIIGELKNYDAKLAKKPQIVVLSKIDGVDKPIVEKKLRELNKVLPKGTKALAISSKTKAGLNELLSQTLALSRAKRYKPKKRSTDKIPVITYTQLDKTWDVIREKKQIIVVGKKIERFAVMTDYKNPDGVRRLKDIMRRMGITRELERMNAEPGQKIQIGTKNPKEIEY